MERGTWWATVHGAAKSQTRLKNFHFFSFQGTKLLGTAKSKKNKEFMENIPFDLE